VGGMENGKSCGWVEEIFETCKVISTVQRALLRQPAEKYDSVILINLPVVISDNEESLNFAMKRRLQSLLTKRNVRVKL
jgi:hypothetical protein